MSRDFRTPGLHSVDHSGGEPLHLGTVEAALVTNSAWTGGRYSVMEQVIAPGRLGAHHVHAREDQLAYVLAGTIGFKVGDDEFDAGPGTAVFRPRGVPHALWNATGEEARMLEITSPGGLEDYFRQVDGLVRAGGLTPGRLAALAGDYGISSSDAQGFPFADEWTPYLSEKYGVALA